MGQVLTRRLCDMETDLRDATRDVGRGCVPRNSRRGSSHFPDLDHLPPELSLKVLSMLNATDLCLAACVWQDLGTDEQLWHGLCVRQWGYVSAYRRRREPGYSARQIYLALDEGTLTFNSDPDHGLEYFFAHRLLDNEPEEIARFLYFAHPLDATMKRNLLDRRRDVLDHVIKLQDFHNQFLPNALRKFFQDTKPPNERNSYLHDMVEKFAGRFVSCNPQLGLSRDAVYVICFSLILLSVDLSSPQIKNKMSKREFIRNTRGAAQGCDDDLAGHMYDNVYLIGHVAPTCG